MRINRPVLCVSLTICSADAAALQRRRLVVGDAALLREVAAARLFVVETQAEIASVGEVVDRLERRPYGGHVVVIDDVTFLDAEQLAAAVVAVDREDVPAVLVHVQCAA